MRWRSATKRAALIACLMSVTASVRADQDSQEGLFVLGQAARVEQNHNVEVAVVIGGDLVVEGRVRTMAVAVGGDLKVMPGAVIDGSALAVGGTLDVSPTAQVAGARMQVASGDFSKVMGELGTVGRAREGPPLWLGPVLRAVQMLALLVLALFIALLAPQPLHRIRQTMLHHSVGVMLAGLGIMLGFGPLCVLLAISVFGIPLIPVAVVTLLLAIVMGLTGLAATIGLKLPMVKREDNLIGASALGMGLLTLVVLIPVLGAAVLFLASFYGAGAVLVSRFGARVPQTAPSTGSLAGSEMSNPVEQH